MRQIGRWMHFALQLKTLKFMIVWLTNLRRLVSFSDFYCWFILPEKHSIPNEQLWSTLCEAVSCTHARIHHCFYSSIYFIRLWVFYSCFYYRCCCFFWFLKMFVSNNATKIASKKKKKKKTRKIVYSFGRFVHVHNLKNATWVKAKKDNQCELNSNKTKRNETFALWDP